MCLADAECTRQMVAVGLGDPSDAGATTVEISLPVFKPVLSRC